MKNGLAKQGRIGPPGAGVPPGGKPGQVLAKANARDYYTAWVDPSGTGGGITVADIYKPYTNFWHVLADPARPPLVLAEADYTLSTPVPTPDQWEEGLGEFTQDFGKTLTFRALEAPDLSPFDDWPDGNYMLTLSMEEQQVAMVLVQRIMGYTLLVLDVGTQFGFASADLLSNVFGLDLPSNWYKIIGNDMPPNLEPTTVQEIGAIQADSAQMLFDGPVGILGLLFSAEVEKLFTSGYYAVVEDSVTYKFIGPSLGGSAAISPADVIAAISSAPGVSLMTDDQVAKLNGIQEGAQPNPPIAQSTGNSPVAVMSQDATTKAIASAGGGGASPAGLSLALEMTSARVGVQTFVPSSFVLPDERLQTIQDRPLFVTRAAVNDITVTLMDSVWPLYAGELWLNPDFSTASLLGGSDKKCDVTLKTSSLAGGATDSVAAQICIGMTQTIPVPLTPGVAYAWAGGTSPIYNYMGQITYYIVTVKGAVTLTLPGLGPVAFPGAGVYSVGAGGAVTSGYSGVNLFLQEPLDCADSVFLGRKAFLRRQPLSYIAPGLQAGLYVPGLTGLVQIGGA